MTSLYTFIKCTLCACNSMAEDVGCFWAGLRAAQVHCPGARGHV